jgi:hypothetical protein
VRGDPSLRTAFARRLALCTYKDPDLPADKALDTALAVLRENFDLAATVDQEVLGLTGAIWKRRFEVSAQKRDLELSGAYYLRGSEQGAVGDEGYTGINAAFVLDLLAELEDADARAAGQQTPAIVIERRRRAQEIREDILGKLPVPPAPSSGNAEGVESYWRLVTCAEAYFGLAQFSTAGPLLERAGKIGVDDWQKETTARQLARLAQTATRWAVGAGGGVASEAKAALADFLGGQAAAAVEAALIGKIGLALSGGGFRAALFHIGVLARLAECDLLRRLEYLSCVSGGSIIGTQFYLEVRKLLIEKSDDAVTRDDYIAIVRKIEKNFLDGVQRNIRTRVAAEWLTNLKMIFVPNYSRTLRVGELYESELFANVCDGAGGRERWLEDLHLDPHGVAPGTFNPKTDNWRRAAKVPILVINATALHTGANPLEAIGQRVHVAELKRIAGFVLVDQVLCAAGSAADDCRGSARHRLVDDEAPGFGGIRREDERIGGREVRRQLCLVAKPCEGHRRGKIRGQPLKLPAERSRSDNHATNGIRLFRKRQRPDEVGGTFLVNEFAGE